MISKMVHTGGITCEKLRYHGICLTCQFFVCW